MPVNRHGVEINDIRVGDTVRLNLDDRSWDLRCPYRRVQQRLGTAITVRLGQYYYPEQMGIHGRLHRAYYNVTLPATTVEAIVERN